MTDIDVLFRELQEAQGAGMPSEYMCQVMKRHQVNIIDAIKIYRRLYNVSLGEAKRTVSASLVWRDEAEAGDQLQKEIIEYFRDHPNGQEKGTGAFVDPMAGGELG
jgi:hypothetical protein